MSMIPVKTKLLCANGNPTPAMMDRAGKAGALAGLGIDCQWDEDTKQWVGDCYNYGFNPSDKSKGGSGAPSGWATLNDLLKMGLSIAGQAYLNNNQAKVAQYGPNGSVLYQTSSIPGAYFQPAAGGMVGGTPVGTGLGLALGTMPMLLIGGAVAVFVLILTRPRH